MSAMSELDLELRSAGIDPSTWDVFDPRNGVPVSRTRFRVLARWRARRAGLDYCRAGEGWIN